VSQPDGSPSVGNPISQNCNCLVNDDFSAPSISPFAASGLLSPALLEKASSSCGLVPSIRNQCANAISEREPDQQANCQEC
jgi:hypothetical protein